MKSMNVCSQHNACLNASANDIFCTKPDCVLPGCINMKLQNMKDGTMSKAKPKRGRKAKSSVGQSTEVRLTEANESTDHFWNQDLDDLDDVLNVLWLNNYGNIPDSQSNNAAATLDLSEQRSSTLQHNYEEVFNLFHDPLAFQALPSRRQGVQNQGLVETQSTSNPGIKVQSKSVQCYIFPENQHLVSDEADSGGTHAHVPSVPHVIDNTIQPINSPNTHNASYNVNFAVSGREASSPGLKRSIKNQTKLQTKYSNSEETGNHSPIKRKPTSAMQSSSKLFGILSLILQVFNSPMTREVEERCAGALQRALTEIQNAHFFYRKLRDNKFEQYYPSDHLK